MRERRRIFQRPGRGRTPAPQGDKPGSGPGGYCVCPSCGHKVPHTRYQPCNERKCPNCGATMTKE